MESRSYPYDCVDLSDIPYRNFTLDIQQHAWRIWSFSSANRAANLQNQHAAPTLPHIHGSLQEARRLLQILAITTGHTLQPSHLAI